MAFDATISTWLTNFAVNSAQTEFSIPIATFPEMTAAEIDDSGGGDIRKFLFAFCDELYTNWAATASADRPSKMTIAKSVTNDVDNDTATETFTFRFVTQASASEVVDES